MTYWEKFKICSNAFAAIFIPIAVAAIGWFYTQSISEREIQGKFVELAVEILETEPTPKNMELRKWGTQIINKYSGVPLTQELQKGLIDKTRLPHREYVPISTEERIKKLSERWRPVFDFIRDTYDEKIIKLKDQNAKIIIKKNDHGIEKIVYDADSRRGSTKSTRSVSLNGKTIHRIIYQPAWVKDGYLQQDLIIFFDDFAGKFDIIFSEESVVLKSNSEKYSRFNTGELVGFLENKVIKDRIVDAINFFVDSAINP